MSARPTIRWWWVHLFYKCFEILKPPIAGWSPGLVVMGGDACSECRDFKSQHYILLDGHFSHIFVIKIVMFV